jgi:hypothetical protein
LWQAFSLSRHPVAFGALAERERMPPHQAARSAMRRLQALAESLVDSGTTSDKKKKPNEFWSEWQDSNLRPLRPERSALPG